MDAEALSPSKSEVSLLAKVVSTDEPIDLPKMLGKEKQEETILEKETRLQNERKPFQHLHIKILYIYIYLADCRWQS